MHQSGIETESAPWQGTILPLDHWCYEAGKINKPNTETTN